MSTDMERWLSAAETRAAIARDQWGRPLIETPSGDIKAYTRTSTLGKALEDQQGLMKWMQRQAVIGVAQRKDLILAAAAHKDDYAKMNEIVETAMEVAGSSAAATTGTALHDLFDQFDQGKDPYVPEEFADDVHAYLEATAALEVVAAEEFAVCDEVECAGTPDRIVRTWAPIPLPDGTELPVGTVLVDDIKTSKSLDYGHIGFSVQTATYSRSYRYDLSAGRTRRYGRMGEIPVGDRRPWVKGEKVNTEWALIIHVPSGQGVASVHPVNITLGWELAQVSRDVREYRKRKDIIAAPVVLEEDFEATVEAAESVRELRSAHARAVRAGKWDADLRELFSARKAEIRGEAA